MQGDNSSSASPAPNSNKPVEQPAEPNNEATNWQYSAENQQTDNQPPEKTDSPPVKWTASEYVEHPKGAKWYFLFILAIAVVSVIVYLLAHSIFSTVMVAVICFILVAASVHKPKVVSYEINSAGLHLGDKFKGFGEFKSFSIFDEGNLGSIILFPLKRFTPPMTIYYDLRDEEKIVNALSDYLPHEETKKDAIEQLMHKLHF